MDAPEAARLSETSESRVIKESETSIASESARRSGGRRGKSERSASGTFHVNARSQEAGCGLSSTPERRSKQRIQGRARFVRELGRSGRI